MFYHVKELQFNARVSKPDPAFASLLLEQFGGANGELAAAMRYFLQAFGAKHPHPDKYDLLMDIATEEFSHLEIVGATIQMLLKGVNGDLKNAAEQAEIMQLLNGQAAKETMIHNAMVNPLFFISSAGGPALTNSQGVSWTADYINGDANGDLTVDLRSDIAAESRAKVVYEYLMQFTDDPYVKETLQFLMTREVAHFQMFQAALETIQPNFPPAVRQSDPRYSNLYFNMSNGSEVKGPWNSGMSSQLNEQWQYIDDPLTYVLQTHGLVDCEPQGTDRTLQDMQTKDEQLSKIRSGEVKRAMSEGIMQWEPYEVKTNDPSEASPL